jgi:FAD:protein FMN transferase
MDEDKMTNTRRRVLKIIALSTGVAMAPNALLAAKNKTEMFEWHGRALGAETSIQLYGEDKEKADAVLQKAATIISKYEKLFSIYDENSATSTLNKAGALENSPEEFIDLLKLSKKFSTETDGAFDITIQPLWNLYRSHFDGDDRERLEGKISAALDIIGSDKITITENDVSFARDNMAVSFNGIAQGYITDKVTEFLTEQGYKNVLVDMGEYRAAAPQANGEPWRIGLLDPFDTVSIADVIEIDSGAVATSGGYGNQFDASGKHHHLFNPATGLSSDRYASVTVRAADATTADALSTAFSNMAVGDIKSTLSKHLDAQARLTFQNGKVTTLVS